MLYICTEEILWQIVQSSSSWTFKTKQKKCSKCLDMILFVGCAFSTDQSDASDQRHVIFVYRTRF